MPGKATIPVHVAVTLVVLGAMWGGAFTLMKVLVDELSAVEMAAGRLFLGSLAVGCAMALLGQLRWPRRELLAPIGVVALLDTLIPYMLVGWAQTRIDSGAAAVLISAMPLFTVIFAGILLRQEAIGAARVIGIALGFAGVLTMLGGPSALQGSSAVGQLAVLGAAAAYAAGALYARRLLTRVEAAPFTMAKLAIGAVLAAGTTAVSGEGASLFSLGWQKNLALVTLGVASTGLSFVLYFRVVTRVGTIAASTVTYIIPVFALVFGALFLDEAVGANKLGGMALIASGVAGVMYGPVLDSAFRRIRRGSHAFAPA
jgi:drug/metabolite transporter (DMT)-like permease